MSAVGTFFDLNQDVSLCGVHLISVQKVTVRPSQESKHWRGL